MKVSIENMFKRLKISFRIALAAFIVQAFIVPAYGQKVLDLKSCISAGLERNFSILISRNTEKIATNNYTPGNAGLLPSLSLSNRYSGTLNNVDQNLSAGGTNSTNGIDNRTATSSANLAWNIFNGFNARTTYRKLGELMKVGELNSQLTAENLISNIVAGYYNYIEQVQRFGNMQYAIKLSRERLRIDEERYLLGSSSKMQVLQSRVYLNADSSSLSKQREVLRAAQISLNELMALDDLGSEFTSEDTTIVVNPSLIYEKLLDETLAGNTSLLIAARNKTISEYDQKIISSRSYPYLSLSSGYSYTYNTYSTGSLKNQTTDGLNYGLTLGMTLFDGFNTRRNIRNATLDVKNKELRYQEVEQGIKADLLTLYNAYRSNLRLIRLEEQNYETASENLEIALERYKLGSLSGLDLRDVQKSLLDARDRLLLVQYQAKLAEISLLLISGKIMNYYQ